ncbi:MAG: DUF1549 and DUF1553 domain-containing protein, partial [Gemmataceae bacterium]|nr:DUF1549 and DUF1553 domain-containing protein [Gemmataceae bacterium]
LPSADSPSFRNHVIPILTRLGCNSGACHGALAGKGGLKLSLRGYDIDSDHFALTRQALGRRIDREAPHKSLLLLKPTAALPHGGGERMKPDSPEYKVLAGWLADGAPGAKDSDPRLKRLEVSPAATTAKVKDKVAIRAKAHYSDGATEDVTRWARFSSSEELVANVDPDGSASVSGHGEATVSVQFGGLVGGSRIVAPFPNKIDDKLFDDAPRANFIDARVLAKLKALRLPPSGRSTDEEFIRRVSLDAAGVLPTAAELEAFLASTDPQKRGKLIDRLLARPEFTDAWAYKWSDLLLITTRRLPQPAVWAFYQFVRQSLADDKPWDRFARDILTATGSTQRNGAANYFVLHKDVSDLTESTAVTFMGMSITCARCHNHPLERWTQDQYWQMANLFSRVTLKDGDKGGSVLVQPNATGEAYHPRKGVPMPPAPLDGKALALDDGTDRRKHFADWLTAEDNPYFARAVVNRVWRSLMGRGLVEAEDDLRETNPPSNPELLDALAKDFIKGGYSVKRLIRTILLSEAYQRSSRSVPGNEGDDRFHSRWIVKRLPGEVILDAYSQVTQVPTPFTDLNTNARDATVAYGGFPLGTRALQLPDSLVASPFLDAFGRPERSQACSCERTAEASVGQALHLNNGKTLNDKLRDKGSVLTGWLAAKTPDAGVVHTLYKAALCRAPSKAETEKFAALLAEAGTDPAARREALEDLCWAVLTSREFVFNR